MRWAALAAAAVLPLGGCLSLAPIHDGPVTITRSLHLGLYHACLSYGLGVMLCEHIRFDPKTCAIVVIYPSPPSQGQLAVLRNLAPQTKALCLAEEKDGSP